MTPPERLRAARKAAGFTSARQAAKALQVPAATYHQHESGARNMNAVDLDRYLRFFAERTR